MLSRLESLPAGQKANAHLMETVHTNERVPGHHDYYEKGGLRTYGDNEDHEHEPPVRWSCSAKSYSS